MIFNFFILFMTFAGSDVSHAGAIGKVYGDKVVPKGGELKDTGLVLPQGFKASVFFENLGRARHLAVAPNGDVYVKLEKLKDAVVFTG
jgi:hypothetical protein